MPTASPDQRLAAATAPGSLAVLDGQVRPSVILEALVASPIPVVEILLVDCSHDRRDHRLLARTAG